MGILGDAIGKSKRAAFQADAPPASATTPPASATTPAVSAPAPRGDRRSELQRRRDALAEQVTELHWDLGGLAYEMAIRDHFRLDVLVRRAALLQERDAELAELERLLHLQDTASIGNCPRCGAPHSRGAMFCWQCGATLMERSTTIEGSAAHAADGADGNSTAVMQALLAPESARVPRRPPSPED